MVSLARSNQSVVLGSGIEQFERIVSGDEELWHRYDFGLGRGVCAIVGIVHRHLRQVVLEDTGVARLARLRRLRRLASMTQSVTQFLPKPRVAPLDVGVEAQVGLELRVQIVDAAAHVAVQNHDQTGSAFFEDLKVEIGVAVDCGRVWRARTSTWL